MVTTNKVIDKVIVWDMDETIGSFVSLSEPVNLLERLLGKQLTQKEFKEVIHIFQEVLRPNIIEVLIYIKERQDENTKNILYTNNNGPKSWCNGIVAYLDNRIGCKVFDNIIRAWEVNGKIIEPNRTSYLKTYEDLVSCLNVDEIRKICFIDDQDHPLHKHSRVTSYKIPQYNVEFTTDEIIKKLKNSSFKKVFKTNTYKEYLYDDYDTDTDDDICDYDDDGPPTIHRKAHDVLLFKTIKKFMKPESPDKKTRKKARVK